MTGGITAEFLSVASALLCGAAVTFVYDLLRIFRRVFPHGSLWIGIEDAFFWLWTAFWTFSVLYRENDGSFRGYTLLSMAAGMIAYHAFFSTPFVECAGKIFKKAVNFILFPLKSCRKKLKNLRQGLIMRFINFKNGRRFRHGADDDDAEKIRR